MNASTPGPDGTITLFPRQHVRRQVGKALGHLAPAIILALGVGSLFSGEEPLTPLVGLEVLAGLTYFGLMVRELWHLRHTPFHQERIAWLEVAAAAILAVESYHLWHRHHAAELAGAPRRTHLLPGVYALVAGLYVLLAFRFQALTQRRYLQLQADGFAVRTRLLFPVLQVRWVELAAIEPVGASALCLHYLDGHKHDLTFVDFYEGGVHRDRLLMYAQAARQGLA